MKLFTKLTLIALLPLMYVSCQKDLETNDVDPPTNDSTILDRVEMVDSTATAPANKSIYAIKYDAEERMKSNLYYVFRSNGLMDSNYRVSVTYNGSDTLPNTLNEIDLYSTPGDTSYDKRFYQYDQQGRLIKDSSFHESRFSGSTNLNYYVNEYTYYNDGFKMQSRHFDYQQGTTTIDERRFIVQKDSRGNVISQEFTDLNNNSRLVEELTYDNNPNPFYQTFLPHYPAISSTMTSPLYLGNLQPQPNNFLTYKATVYDLTTGAITFTRSQVYTYTYKPNGYPLRARVTNTPAQPFFDNETFNYFYRN